MKCTRMLALFAWKQGGVGRRTKNLKVCYWSDGDALGCDSASILNKIIIAAAGLGRAKRRHSSWFRHFHPPPEDQRLPNSDCTLELFCISLEVQVRQLRVCHVSGSL